MAAYHQVYDSRRLQTDCQEPESAPEPYARQSSVWTIFTFFTLIGRVDRRVTSSAVTLWISVRFSHAQSLFCAKRNV